MAYLIKGAHVVDPQVGLDGVCDVLVEGKQIAKVAQDITAGEDTEVIEGAGKYLIPGLVDMHVHLRRQGESKPKHPHSQQWFSLCRMYQPQRACRHHRRRCKRQT